MAEDKNQGVVAIGLGIVTFLPAILLFLQVNLLIWIPLVAGGTVVVLGSRALSRESWLSRNIGWIALVVMIVVFGGLVRFSVYSNQPGPPVRIIIPNGYRGPFKLVVDSQRGIEINEIDGSYTYEIPRDGILIIKSSDPFYGRHRMSAAFANGDRIPVDPDSVHSSENVRLISLGSGHSEHNGLREEHIDYFVGSEFDYRLYERTHNH